MTAAEKVISVARGELGYREKRSNSSLDDKTANAGSGNWTKYARDLDAMTDFYNGAKNGYAWCDVFVDWCFYKAFGAETAKKLLCQPSKSAGAGCTYSLAYYLQKGQFYRKDPQPGDQIFFGSVGNSNHTGLVVEVSGGKVHTIEGNTSDGVYERSYALGAGNIAGYGRPDWSIVGDVSNSDTSGSVAGAPGEGLPFAGERKKEGANMEFSPEGGNGMERVSSDADPYADKPGTQSGGESCTVELPEVYAGCVGEAVKATQLLLIGRGYSCGPDGADGDFGANTKSAVLKFQRAKGLEADGVVGRETWTGLTTGNQT